MTDKQSFNFEKLLVYQRSLKLSIYIFNLTNSWPKEHLFGITNQFRRASSSVPLNIAEESSGNKKELRHYLNIARGSCFECIPIIEIALSLKMVSEKEKYNLYNELIEIARMLSSLRTSLNK